MVLDAIWKLSMTGISESVINAYAAFNSFK